MILIGCNIILNKLSFPFSLKKRSNILNLLRAQNEYGKEEIFDSVMKSIPPLTKDKLMEGKKPGEK